MMDLEICSDSLNDARIAAEYGFKRIELCANLTEGGTTSSLGMIQACVALETIEVHTMIRPRGGSFVYSKSELDIMARDILAAASVGAKGVVFGCLNSQHKLDLHPTLFLAEFALKSNLEMTFHRAIDFTPDPLGTLEHLFAAGFTRVLTSGGKNTASEGIELIEEMIRFSEKNPIQIMAGGGVNATNVLSFAELGIHAVHFTARKPIPSDLPQGMGTEFETDREKIEAVLRKLQRR